MTVDTGLSGGLRRESVPLACWDCWFESRRGHVYLSCVCCVLSRRCLCVEPITRPEESYRACV